LLIVGASVLGLLIIGAVIYVVKKRNKWKFLQHIQLQ
jgi:hypothetical protein